MLDKMISSQFAYHESGHAILAHIFGDYIVEINLNFNYDNNTPAFVNKIYGQEKYYYLAFDNNSLTQLIECNLEHVEFAAKKYCMSNLGGPIAEQVYVSGRKDNLELQYYDTPDFNLCKNAVSLLCKLYPYKDYSEFIKECITMVLCFFREEKVWSTIELLSKRLLEKEDKILIQPDINTIFEKGGLNDFMKSKVK